MEGRQRYWWSQVALRIARSITGSGRKAVFGRAQSGFRVLSTIGHLLSTLAHEQATVEDIQRD